MKVVIAGGSGFLGRALSDALAGKGHEVVVLTRRAGGDNRSPTAGARSSRSASRRQGGPGSASRDAHPATRLVGPSSRVSRVQWTPDGSTGAWASEVDGADAVVNLAGESIAAGRWNERRKRAILESRVLATRSLVAAIAAARRAPSVFASASGQNYYGDHGDEEVTEASGPGTDFMADVCVRWEGEAQPAAELTRLVLLRTALVLSASEGALPRMLLPFKLFGGGPLGSGRQFTGWIHWRDWVEVTAWVIESARVAGPLNVSAPTPVRNSEFSATLGRVLHRPSWLPAPAFAIRAVVGEMADSLLFTSTRLVPQRLIAAGYEYEFGELPRALEDLLGR